MRIVGRLVYKIVNVYSLGITLGHVLWVKISGWARPSVAQGGSKRVSKRRRLLPDGF